jgi:hypothetical protein
MSNSVVVTPRPNVAVFGNRGGPQGVQGPQGLPGSLFAYVLPQTYGAVGDGVHDDTSAFNLALVSSAFPHVFAPAGTYWLPGGLTVPANATLQLAWGASLLLGGPLDLGNYSRLLGLASFSPASAEPFYPNVVWGGAPGGIPLRIGVASDAAGVLVQGITVDGNAVANVTGCQVGTPDALTWGVFERFSVVRVLNGIDFRACQQWRGLDVTCYNPDEGGTVSPSAGWGIRFGDGPGTVTDLDFHHTRVQGFTELVRVEDVFGLTFRDGYLVTLPKDGGCALNVMGGESIRVYDVHFDGPTGEYGDGTTRLVKVGTTTSSVSHLVIEGCSLNLATVLVEGFAWQSFTFRNNTVSVAPGRTVFLNSGGGPVRKEGWYGPNLYTGSGPENSGGWAGFDVYWLSNGQGLSPTWTQVQTFGAGLTVTGGVATFSTGLSTNNVAAPAGQALTFSTVDRVMNFNPGPATGVNYTLIASNLFYRQDSDSAVYYYSRLPSDAGHATRNSPAISLRGNFWNGTVSQDVNMTFQCVPSANGIWRLAIGADFVEKLAIENTGDLVLSTTAGNRFGTATNQKIAWWGATPVVQNAGWSTANSIPAKALDVNMVTLTNVANVLATLLEQLKTYGLLGG